VSSASPAPGANCTRSSDQLDTPLSTPFRQKLTTPTTGAPSPSYESQPNVS
jgi:hypothetical protein